MTVKVDKDWDSIAGQRVFDGEKCWLITDLIERSKDLDVMDVPMRHLCIDKEIATIAGLPLRVFVAHMKQVLDCDMSKPIIMDENGATFDGRHRLARALLDGAETIKAVRFEKDPEPTYTRDVD